MRFVLLGPVHGLADDRPVDLGPARQRCVLAALLAEPGRSVSTDTLIGRVWGSNAPSSVHSALYSYITRLRDVLRYAGGEQTVIRADGGYRLDADIDEVDLWQWNALLDQAKSSSGDERRELLGQALQLWNGRALGNLASDWAEQTRQRLERQRIEMLADWAELEIDAGRPGEVALALADPVAEHPLAEPLVAALMRALHLAGRTAEALECYAAIRERAVAEFGVEPGHVLRDLHVRILRSDPPARPEPARPVGPALVRGPAQLPATVAGFTGRQDALARLDLLLEPAEPTEAAVKIVVIAGTAGVGKTALALNWAHRAAGRYPDGQIHLDLHGYSEQAPIEPTRALELILQALGVSADRIPPDLGARVGLYRSTVADRRILVVLDNASRPEQVRPLLPGEPGCAVLITSRDALAGLVAVDGAHRVQLDVLAADEAVALLIDLLPTHGSPDSLARLADVCARLPLALRIAAANLGGQPIDEYVHSLAADPLRGRSVDGDPDAVVGAQFAYSYRNLDPDSRRLFALLGSLPGIDVSVYSAAALIGSTVDEAGQLLRRLVNAHLVEPAWGRYTFHDLLRAYAGQCATRDSDPHEQGAALQRFFDWHLSTASAAMDVVDPNRRRLTPSEPTVPAVTFESYDDALAWLDAERPVLTVLPSVALQRGWYEQAWRLPQAIDYHQRALDLHQNLDDLRHEAMILLNLGVIYNDTGRYLLAREYYERSAEACRIVGDRRGEAVCIANSGVSYEQLGNHAQAIEYMRQALSMHRRNGDRDGEATVLGSLGYTYCQVGRYPEALALLHEARLLAHELGEPDLEAEFENDLGSTPTPTSNWPTPASSAKNSPTSTRNAATPTSRRRSLDVGRPDHQAGGLPGDRVAAATLQRVVRRALDVIARNCGYAPVTRPGCCNTPSIRRGRPQGLASRRAGGSSGSGVDW